MARLFIFGTLRHLPLFNAVIGKTDHVTFTPATLPGFSVLSVAEGPFPTIRADRRAEAQGLVVDGLTAQDWACLDYYEEAFGYTLGPVRLDDGQTAQAYFPPATQGQTAGPWELAAWERNWAALSILAATEVMTYQGVKTGPEVAAMFPMIRARAWSRLNAALSRHGAGTLKGRVEISAHRRPYASYFVLDEYELSHERFDGSMTPEVLRAVFLTPDATLVLPYDPCRDRVLLVEQMRMGPLARGDGTQWQLEPIAGRLDPGETPQAAARREALEEAGLTLGAMEPVAEAYCSPGYSTEFFYIYLGAADLPDDVTGVGGLASEEEDIRSHTLSFEALMELCDSQQIANAPLVMVSYWLARHRERLRADPAFRTPAD